MASFSQHSFQDVQSLRVSPRWGLQQAGVACPAIFFLLAEEESGYVFLWEAK